MSVRKKPRPSLRSILESYGVPPTTTLRHRTPPEKGILWYWTSQYVRRRDARRWGTCISCGTPATFETLQAGHYGAAANCGLALLFDLRNVNGECARCNAWDDGHLVGYEAGYIHRHGQASMDKLKAEYLLARSGQVTTPAWSILEYKAKIAALRALCDIEKTA